jgi:hypothetical protein
MARNSTKQPVSPDFEAVLADSQKNLSDFLRVEIQLAFSMLAILKTSEGEPERQQPLVTAVRSALVTVKRFEGRLTDSTVRAEVVHQAEKLKADLKGYMEPG